MDGALAQYDAFMAYVFSQQKALTTWAPAYVLVPVYLVLTLGTQFLMRNKTPFGLRKGLGLHNLFLCIWSIAMLVGTIFELYRSFSAGNSFQDIYCGSYSTKGISLTNGLWFWAWLFYVSKYYEFFDTAFIVLRKNRLIFLHVYHHVVVVPLSLVYVLTGMTFFLNGVIANTLIHTFMYWNYYQQSRGVSVWWKKFLTTAQIVQFVWGITTLVPYPYLCGLSYFSIEGPMLVFWFHQVVLLSFTFLFIQFFNTRYSDDKNLGKKIAKDVKTATNGAVADIKKLTKKD